MKLQKEAIEIIATELQKALEDGATFAPRTEVEWAFVELLRYAHGETNEREPDKSLSGNGSETSRTLYV